MAEASVSRYLDIHFSDPSFPMNIRKESESCLDHADRDSQIFHEELEIKYFYEGSSTLIVDTSAIVTQPGDIILINPYEFHSTVEIDQNIGKYHLFMIGLDLFTAANPAGLDLRRLLIANGVKFNRLVRGNNELIRLLQRVITENSEQKEHYALACRALLTEFFIHLLREEIASIGNNAQPVDRIRHHALIAPAIGHIHTAYHARITVDELAELCAVSKYHFCRQFKLATGMTAMQYLMNYRLRIARAFLEASEMSCSEISRRCGFADESYFSRAYKRQFSISPQQHRAILSEK